ncbi:AMP-binding protein [Rhodovastum atsumiense]|uniref:AMP-binding protein n=1 Tax=Rhodovastum atsumiense TaxID=504468 RepID=A0A5M6IL26_9PROT|nr:AMP-binding protein [Rhodovastum atsumiense]KAA5608960.1 AMP-binding protein [Rhodovastum atsumiense]CAH2603695.1 AMP-binding protein [Rhodovastum atsumiense]
MPAAGSITAPLAGHALRAPDGIAIRWEQDAITWAALDGTVHRLAAFLAGRIPPGRGLAMALPNEPALFLLILAAIRAGREVQILDPAWPAETRRAVLAQLRPGLLVGADGIVLPPRLGFAAVADALDAPRDLTRLPEPAAETPFYVGFTSGTTGMPKGFRRHQLSWLESFRGDDAILPIGPTDGVLALGSLVHSNFLYAFLRAVHAGATITLCRHFAAGAARRLLDAGAASVLYGVPSQLQMVMEAGRQPCAAVRLIYSSGAKFPPERRVALAAQFPRARFCEYYGASETSFIAMTGPEQDAPPESVGRPFPGVRVTIRDHDGTCLPEGATGLVFVESPLCFLGYATEAEATLLRAGAAVSLGDVGRFDAAGFLHIVGRASRMIISSGKNIHPEAIEARLQAHPAVAAAAVLGLADAQRGERLVAVLHCPQAVPARRDLVAGLRAHLPPHEVPQRYLLLPEWSYTPSGKTDFAAIRRRIAAGEGDPLS